MPTTTGGRQHRSRGRRKVHEIPDTSASHRSFCASLEGKNARVCLESTGVYHLDVAKALAAADGVEVMVVDPRSAHAFARATMARNKNDTADAEVLLTYGERMPWQTWVPPSEASFELRTICRHMVSVRKQLAAEKTRLKRTQATSSIAALVQEDIVLSIAQMISRIETLQGTALAVIAADEELSESLALLCSIAGFGSTSAVQLLSELCVLPEDMTPKQWIAHAGLDPRQHQSGSSIEKAPRISKAGNAYLRRARTMSALVALQNSPHVAAFYAKLVGAGKPKMKGV